MSPPLIAASNKTKDSESSKMSWHSFFSGLDVLSHEAPDVDFDDTFDLIGDSEVGERTFPNGSLPAPSGNVALNGTSDDFYDYDREKAFETFFWDQLLPPLIVYSISLVLGLVGNSLIIYTVSRYRGMKTTTNVFLASLASADLLLLLICIPVKTAKVFSYSWTLGWFLCKSLYYLQNVSVFCSVLTLTAMSLERYYAIVFPFRSQYLLTVRQAQRVTGLVWLVSLVLASPILVVQVHSRVGVNVEAYWCHRDWAHPYTWRSYETYMLILVLILPAVIMTFAYSSLIFQLGHVLGERDSFVMATQTKMEIHPLNGTRISPQRASSDKDMRQVVRMLIAVVLLFILSWSPLLITNVIWSWGYFPPYDPNPFYKHLFNAVHLIAYFNSCINPVVYGFLSKNFRQSFQTALCPCLRKADPPTRQISLSRSRHTSVRESVCLGVRNSRATCV